MKELDYLEKANDFTMAEILSEKEKEKLMQDIAKLEVRHRL